MVQTNMKTTRVKPAVSTLTRLEVLRREQLSPRFVRVTLGGGDIGAFTPMGFDQWFRLFIPTGDPDVLDRMPARLDTKSYLRYLTMSRSTRPVLRNYTVRAFREEGPDGPELDVDLVVHGSAADGTAGPASTWALTCHRGDRVAIIDEGVMFNPSWADEQVLLVADESAVPAAAGILASLPADAVGEAVLEVPTEGDRLPLERPEGVRLTWIVRSDPSERPGAAAFAEASLRPVPDGPVVAWVAGEQSLPTGMRREWVRGGIPKDRILFCGYWKAGHAH
ncbi:Siderophore-interacting protein [Nostocoides japonicum T1-X7]|uniref:Siderophore-interacting protein n=1 Tax=Nostocoides japonicum T1-X7 TaxID=1194083 RepID=A0A077M2B9_9MICO|nr:siderophore-interacting protein [Tetrasphaera japonica]CCH78369.1 Siderophore-interacting protein [Tetrasphaera japonica T1-X7]